MNYPGLSKSRIVSAYQCPKILHLQKYRPELRHIDAATQERFDVGHQIGEIAQQLFPDGYLIEHDNELQLAIEETEKLLKENKYIMLFEATFSFENVLVRVDVLHKVGNIFHVIEVKSSTKVKDYHIIDSAIQTWVIKSLGYEVSRVDLAHVNTGFIFQGDQNYRGLLNFVDITREVLPELKQVPKWVSDARTALQPEIPEITIGAQCFKPFKCDYMGQCWPQTDYPVTILPNASKKILELTALGINDVRQIPEDYLTSEKHKKIRRVTISGNPEISPEASEQLNALPYPRYYIDFESLMSAIPIWIGTSPYKQYPFQWSCHIEHKKGKLEHKEFLDGLDPNTRCQAPMRVFIETLIEALDSDGPIFVYSSFEKSRLNELAELYPDLKLQIQKIIERLVDLLEVINNYYYHPAMKGSFSIKYVLPTVAPELSYKGMAVADGGMAMTAYRELIHPDTSESRQNEIGQALKAYCGLDTLAMVKVVDYFQNKERENE